MSDEPMMEDPLEPPYDPGHAYGFCPEDPREVMNPLGRRPYWRGWLRYLEREKDLTS